MRKIVHSLLILLVIGSSTIGYAQVDGYQSAPFGVTMTCKGIEGNYKKSTEVYKKRKMFFSYMKNAARST